MIKYFVLIIIFISVPVNAAKEQLTNNHLERIDKAHGLLIDVDTRSRGEIKKEFNLTAYPEGNLQIYEALAATYHDLIERKGIKQSQEKIRLYDYIRLNIAYLQFGGDVEEGGRDLNLWIRQTLRRYLPEELMNNRELFYSLND